MNLWPLALPAFLAAFVAYAFFRAIPPNEDGEDRG
jgi:hypothetical protein